MVTCRRGSFYTSVWASSVATPGERARQRGLLPRSRRDARGMKRWGDLARDAPDIAAAGRELVYYHGVGLGVPGDDPKDGGPRVHPVCPVIDGEGLYLFVGHHSPKAQDLRRDGRFALYSCPVPDVDDEFFVAGKVRWSMTIGSAGVRVPVGLGERDAV